MHLITNDSEKSLQTIANQLDRAGQWWALQLKTSQFDSNDYDASQIKTALNVLTDKCASYDGTIFFCGNRDLVLIFDVLSRKDREELLREIQYVFMDDPFSRQDGFYKWYDSMLYHDLILVCQEYNDKRPQKKVNQPIESEGKIAAKPIISMADFSLASEQRKKRETLKILIAEDDLFSRKLTKKALEKDHEVILASNGREAIEKYTLHAPDVMFLDIGMPIINGINVLDNLVHIDSGAFIVMLTSDSTCNVVKGAISHGAKGYIIKPFSMDKLTFYIQNYKEYQTQFD